ncbi:MAG: bifunctional demethylmenaquinone methyltransferase/2-methoxy-6-polyprenyl-1,4-benzoquinol methylase UbiE [Deltaproteobacteria bacterium]|nr:bifunctional demethylmenaquinone methyltransferase/2-methoxy-6-polyprenyl-1,4-benzoquinol methylase UbiE [Deltaproteobacteria bacterium]
MTQGNSPDTHCQPPHADVSAMFDRVARRYDLVNRLLSVGIDRFWRKKMAAYLPPGHNLNVLDLATGTADQLLFLFKGSHRIGSAIGLDLAEKMLAIGRAKIARAGLSEIVSLRIGDATEIDAPPDAFDAVTISFGIRNVKHTNRALSEMYRVLKPGGRVLVLEFSLPERPLLRGAYLGYLRYFVPGIGGWVSGDLRAYRYLNRSIEAFPSGPAFLNLLSGAGFAAVVAHPLSFGIATIYCGDKPADGRPRSDLGAGSAAMLKL